MAEKSEETRIPLVEETARVEKRPVEKGKVRVRTVTEQIDDVLRTTLAEQTADIRRVPVNREVERVPEVRTEGDLTIIPVVEEIAVVEKRLVVREELHIKRTSTSKPVEVPVTRRKQRAIVERDAEEEQ